MQQIDHQLQNLPQNATLAALGSTLDEVRRRFVVATGELDDVRHPDLAVLACLIHHGGSGFGYISDMLWLPEHQVGAVILTNSEQGGSGVRNAFRRRLLEVLFDGEAQAAARVAVFAKDLRQAGDERGRSLRTPVPKTAAATLAPRYRSPELGDIVVTRSAAETRFDFGGWSSVMAVRASEAKTFVTISPAVAGFEFVAGVKGELRTLSLHDAQREYVFVEVAVTD